MNKSDLAQALELHLRWKVGDADGVRADLSGADLSGADLSGADLSGADLSGAKFDDAVLADTCLNPQLVLLQREFCIACPANAEGYRIVYRTATSRHVGDTEYVPGQTYTAPVLSADIATACHPGIYAASLEWMRREYPNEKLVRCRVQDGDWFLSAKGAIRTCKLEVLAYVEVGE